MTKMAFINPMINVVTHIGCRVEGCRHTQSHTTRDHVCGRCGENGHGVLECRNDNKKTNLSNFSHEQLPQSHWCTYPNCSSKEYHTIESHHCENCGLRTPNSNHYCPVKHFNVNEFTNMVDINSDIVITDINFNAFLENKNNIYFRIPFKDVVNKNLYIRKCNTEIMSLVIRFNNDWTFIYQDDENLLKRFTKNNTLEDETNEFITFNTIINQIDNDIIQAIMGSGGYDDLSDTDDEMPELVADDDFYTITETDTKKCPICRTINTKDECFEIKGLTEECTVCMSSNIEMLYSKCKHACVCKRCYELL